MGLPCHKPLPGQLIVPASSKSNPIMSRKFIFIPRPFTVAETLETIGLARKNGYNCFISHRSVETVDTFIADLTVGMNTGHLKTGSGCRGERIEKFNQFPRIEQQLGGYSSFAGKSAFKNA